MTLVFQVLIMLAADAAGVAALSFLAFLGWRAVFFMRRAVQ